MPWSKGEATTRWTARVLAALLVGLVLLFIIGEGGINPMKLTSFEAILTTLHLVTWFGLPTS